MTDTYERPTRGQLPERRPPSLRALRADFGWQYVGAGATGVLFSATGPVAVIMGAAAAGALSAVQTASWVFGVFVLNGILTVVASWVYRMPLSFFWTIPGTVLVGQSLASLTWPEVVGAYLTTGVLVIVLGVTGVVTKLMAFLPQSVVMAMVAGAFLSFGTGLVQSVSSNAIVAGAMVVAWLALTRSAMWSKRIPPVLAALAAGLVALAVTGGFTRVSGPAAELPLIGLPELVAPAFSGAAMAQLVIPLAITVVAVQNGQGAAVLNSAGHRPPMTVVTIACGIWSLLAAPLGAVSTCLAGPTNALLVAVGARSRQYIAGMTCGAIAVVVGLLAPLLVRGLSVVPATFIAALAGLAMLEPLRGAFTAAFSDSVGRPVLAPLVTLMVTISGTDVGGLGAPFWGLVAGVGVTFLLDRRRSPTVPSVHERERSAPATPVRR